MKLQKKILSTLATSALLMNSFVGAVFAETTTLTVTGNGADSQNQVNVGTTTTTTVTQTNVANISNNVDAKSTTGDNWANKNTGGDVTVLTGDASTAVSVENAANSNVAHVEGCCASNTNVEVSGNGADSVNAVNAGLTTNTTVAQNNVADIKNKVDAKSDTGDNWANKNTGGDVTVWSGNADTTVLISNQANSNMARVGGGDGAGSLSLRILGNGADSQNAINLGLERSTVLAQQNAADIRNNVDADAKTGENDANENTGGDVTVLTGDAFAGAAVDNMANFNVADLNCGCLLDVLAKVSGNGADSKNAINAGLTDTKVAAQSNDYDCGGYGLPSFETFGFLMGGKHHGCNNVDVKADTGANDANENSGGVNGDDPFVSTGNADTAVELSTTANSNVLNENSSSFEMPNFDFHFDMGSNWLSWMGWFMGMSK